MQKSPPPPGQHLPPHARRIRLARALCGAGLATVLPIGLALVTLRPNMGYDGLVAFGLLLGLYALGLLLCMGAVLLAATYCRSPQAPLDGLWMALLLVLYALVTAAMLQLRIS